MAVAGALAVRIAGALGGAVDNADIDLVAAHTASKSPTDTGPIKKVILRHDNGGMQTKHNDREVYFDVMKVGWLDDFRKRTRKPLQSIEHAGIHIVVPLWTLLILVVVMVVVVVLLLIRMLLGAFVNVLISLLPKGLLSPFTVRKRLSRLICLFTRRIPDGLEHLFAIPCPCQAASRRPIQGSPKPIIFSAFPHNLTPELLRNLPAELSDRI